MLKFFAHIKTSFLSFLLLFISTAETVAQEQTSEPYLDTATLSVQPVQDSEVFFDTMSDSTSIIARTIPDSVVKKIKADEDYWYAQAAPERQKQKQVKTKEEERWYQKDWFAKLLWFLIVGSFVAIIIWFLASSNIRLFRKQPNVIDEETGEINEETIFALPYEREIQKAIASQNFRLATRLWYLRTLKDLTEKNIIHYKQEKTDRDYVNELYKTSYYKGFFHLTRSFEYTWYGKFELSQEAFNQLQQDFINFKIQLP